jgi:hypothetical protein
MFHSICFQIWIVASSLFPNKKLSNVFSENGEFPLWVGFEEMFGV